MTKRKRKEADDVPYLLPKPRLMELRELASYWHLDSPRKVLIDRLADIHGILWDDDLWIEAGKKVPA